MSAFLIPLTTEAREAVQEEKITIDIFPFRIGRESRIGIVSGKVQLIERRKKAGVQPNNDLYIRDEGERLNISREHLQIDRSGDSSYVVVDRGSACGTIVDGDVIGGQDTTGSVPIRNDSIIVIGTQESPYRFRFKCPE